MVEERVKRYKHCDYESERDLSWIDWDIYTAENGGKWWRVINNAFEEIPKSSIVAPPAIIVSETEPSNPPEGIIWIKPLQ